MEMNAGGVNGNRGAAIKQVDADIFQYPPIAEQKSDIPDIPLVFEKIVVPFVSEHVEPDQVPEKCKYSANPYPKITGSAHF